MGILIPPNAPFPYSLRYMIKQVSETLFGDERSRSTAESQWNVMSWAIHCFASYFLATNPAFLNKLFFVCLDAALNF